MTDKPSAGTSLYSWWPQIVPVSIWWHSHTCTCVRNTDIIAVTICTCQLVFLITCEDLIKVNIYLASTARDLSLPKSVKHSPFWEVNTFSATQEIPLILWNPKVHCRIHNSSQVLSTLSHTNLVGIFVSYLLKIKFLSSHLRLGLPHGHFPVFVSLPSHIRPTFSVHLLDLITLIILGKEDKSWSSSLCSCLQCPVTSCSSAPYSRTQSVCDFP